MSYQLATLGVDHPLLADSPGAGRRFRQAVEDLLDVRGVRYRTLWAYYANPMRLWPVATTGGSEQPYRQAQEWGVPSRLTGHVAGDEPFHDAPVDATRKEVVIENDIGWRIDTMVDTLFGRPFVLESDAPDPDRAALISRLLRATFAANGGLQLLQRMALLGAVYGSVDVVVKLLDSPAALPDATCSTAALGGEEGHPAVDEQDLSAHAACVRFELVEPARVLPIADAEDPSHLLAWAQVYRVPASPGEALATARSESASRAQWLRRLLFPQQEAADLTIVELYAPGAWHKYRGEKLIAQGVLPEGMLPVVHVQNVVRPFTYEGGSDVEPLIPLQDRLNTHLSDRASRVTLQSMKMYLGVGIEGFSDEPVQPGRMWSSDNPDARVEEFGGDSSSPSEEAAIRDMREALDKQSGVNPVAAGAIRNRVGNLSSAAALRLTFQALLVRTERKRAVYGAAVGRMCELALTWLDAAGRFKTEPHERRIRLTWPDPIPAGLSEQLEQAALKQRLGVDPDTVRRELGY